MPAYFACDLAEDGQGRREGCPGSAETLKDARHLVERPRQPLQVLDKQYPQRHTSRRRDCLSS
jgi:hypothetical protein